MSENADNYLVRGFVVVTNLDGEWNVQFPTYEVPLNTEQVGHEAVLNIPSAFHLFIFGRDWLSAHEIVKARKDAFTTPGLKGWRAVTLGNVNPADARMRFSEAADAFASDSEPVDTEDGRTAQIGTNKVAGISVLEEIRRVQASMFAFPTASLKHVA